MQGYVVRPVRLRLKFVRGAQVRGRLFFAEHFAYEKIN